jgi:predicted TIM-barrel fold metal-dependent hydrolase
MRTITLEEHYMSPTFAKGPGAGVLRMVESMGMTRVPERITDVGAGRIAEMDAAGIDVQVLSLNAPGVEQLEPADAVAIARAENDYLADAVRRRPDRFAGFAVLPTPQPEAAATELDRAVREYGFKGAMIFGHIRGRYLDDPFFRPILQQASTLQVPIYLHPAPPPKPVIDASYGGFAPDLTRVLATAAWGWHIETAVHVLRLIAGGVFDRFPRLQIVIGHDGEGLPFMLPRLDASLPAALTKLARRPSEYLRENVYYTLSGWTYPATFLNLLLEVGADRIMFSADYPFLSMSEARAFLDRLPVSPADKERIAHGNAERLLRMS